MYALVLWMTDGYMSYSICILSILIATLMQTLYEKISNLRQVRDMSLYRCDIGILSSVEAEDVAVIDSTELLPGDIVKVPQGKVLPCDMILVKGEVVVDESVLTGESVPVIKTSLQNNQFHRYSQQSSVKQTLYGGTKAIQVRGDKSLEHDDQHAVAIISRTGF